ncbi:MAG: transposase [Firmicutes bacterium]|nr:transposase [Bacillota bacterium]
MARKARGASPEGVYHITQRSASDRVLFTSDDERAKFLELVLAAKTIYGFKLFAYCLQSECEYHLILHANGSDLSKIMKSINIAYAMYVKCDGQLFKDRYTSSRLENECEYEVVASQVKCLSDAANCFNSDPKVCDSGSPFDLECKTCIRTLTDATLALERIARKEGISKTELLSEKSRRNALILEFRKLSTLSLKELGELFGGLTESSVSKIIKTGL